MTFHSWFYLLSLLHILIFVNIVYGNFRICAIHIYALALGICLCYLFLFSRDMSSVPTTPPSVDKVDGFSRKSVRKARQKRSQSSSQFRSQGKPIELTPLPLLKGKAHDQVMDSFSVDLFVSIYNLLFVEFPICYIFVWQIEGWEISDLLKLLVCDQIYPFCLLKGSI